MHRWSFHVVFVVHFRYHCWFFDSSHADSHGDEIAIAAEAKIGGSGNISPWSNVRSPYRPIGRAALSDPSVCGISITRFVMYRHVGSGFLAHYNDETCKLKSISNPSSVFIDPPEDYTSPVFFWTNIELSTSVVSACLPTLRPIYIHFKSPPPSNDNSVPLSSYPKLSSRYGRRSRSGRRMSDTFDEQERIALRNNSNVEPVLSPGSQK